MLYVLCYGAGDGTGRGLAQVALNGATGALALHDFIPMQEKPGAMAKVGKRYWLSFLNEDSGAAGIDVFDVADDGQLIRQHRCSTPFYFSYFHPLGEIVLGASFRDGADAVFAAQDPGQPLCCHRHAYRPGMADARQQACHSHFIAPTPDGAFAYAVDLGTDEVLVYRLAQGKLSYSQALSLDCPTGWGPRLMPMSPDGRFAYLLYEMANRVAVLQYQHGQFKQRQILSVLAEDYQGNNSAAACRLSPDGHYLLVSNRGENTLVLFRIEAATGLLSFCQRIPCADTPRDLLFCADLVLVAAQGGHRLQVFRLDRRVDQLVEQGPGLALSSPVALLSNLSCA